jgi:hypothetical protein
MQLPSFGVALLLIVRRLPIVDSRVAKNQPLRDETNCTYDNLRRKLVQTDSDDGISGTYIVHLKDGLSDKDVEEKAEEMSAMTGGKILWTFTEIFKGFAISRLDSYGVIAKLLDHVDVESMDQVCILQYKSCVS